MWEGDGPPRPPMHQMDGENKAKTKKTKKTNSEMIYVLTSHWTETSVILLWDFYFYSPRIFDRDLDSLSHFCSLFRDSSQLASQLIGYVVDL